MRRNTGRLELEQLFTLPGIRAELSTDVVSSSVVTFMDVLSAKMESLPQEGVLVVTCYV